MRLIVKHWLLIIVYLFSFLVSAIVTATALSFISNRRTNLINPNSANIPKGVVVDKNKNINILMLGYGGDGHSGAYLTDMIILASFNPIKNKIFLISIPRDTWVPIPIRSDKTEYGKINSAYAIGHDDNSYPLKEPKYKGSDGPGNMIKKVVETVTGIKADYYISIDFDGVIKAVDQLGGIDVDVPVTFNDYFYPIKGLENETCGKSGEEISELSSTFSGFELEKQFECRYEHIQFQKGLNHMDGTTALKFVRSRHSNEHGGDFARSQRQQAVFAALENKLLSFRTADDLVTLFEMQRVYVNTDIKADFAVNYINNFFPFTQTDVENIYLNEENVLQSGKSANGQFILSPKNGSNSWEQIQKYINKTME